MKKTHRRLAVPMLAALAIATVAVTASPNRSPTNPLQVSMQAVDAGAGSFLGAIEVTVTNTGEKAARVPRWELPSDFPETQQFRIIRDGKPVAYEGRLVKRGAPVASDFVVLRPGQSFKVVVDLSSSYDLSATGTYEVEMSTRLQFASLSGGARLQHANGVPMRLRSQNLRLWVDGSDQLGARKQGNGKGKPGGGGGGNTVVGGVSYAGCSTTQIDTLGDAIAAARGYSENAKNYMNGSLGQRYTTWFGTVSASRSNTVKQSFAKIDTAMDQGNGEITIDCGCRQRYYAYVYPNQHYKIYVCKAFWSAPLTGTDSKAGTLIHEMSHFDVVAGTDDVVYGQSGARNLAISDPDAAIRNADSHEYFSENTPFQN
jgi:peptidyl-Lys metalloendopeptidase